MWQAPVCDAGLAARAVQRDVLYASWACHSLVFLLLVETTDFSWGVSLFHRAPCAFPYLYVWGFFLKRGEKYGLLWGSDLLPALPFMRCIFVMRNTSTNKNNLTFIQAV